MKTKKYRLFHTPLLAFFSGRLYRDVARNWKGVNFAYLFLLLAICCVPATLQMRQGILKSLESGHVDILNQLPEIHIVDGEASVKGTQPHYIRNGQGDPIAIIDTTGSMNYIDDPTVQVMLTESKLIVRRGRNLFNTFNLEGITDLTINKHILNEWVRRFKDSIAPLSYGIFLMLSYIFAVMALMFVAIVGLIVSSLVKNSLGFTSVMRIATVAATPSIIAITVLAAMGITLPVSAYLATTFLYLFIGIKASQKNVTEEDEEGRIDLKALLHENEFQGIRSFEEAA